MAIRVCPDLASWARVSAELFCSVAKSSVEKRGRFVVAISGGHSPKRILDVLATEFSAQAPWANVYMFWVDERCVPPTDNQSNYRMARHHLLSKVAIPEHQIFRVPSEEPLAANAARRYEDTLRLFFGKQERPRFDLILLGLGDDGHTASLFPETPALKESVRNFVENHVPQLKSDRLTMTFPVINNAHNVAFLCSGSSKAKIVKRVIENKEQDLPASHINPVDGQLTWILDLAAADELKQRSKSK